MSERERECVCVRVVSGCSIIYNWGTAYMYFVQLGAGSGHWLWCSKLSIPVRERTNGAYMLDSESLDEDVIGTVSSECRYGPTGG